MNRQLFFVAAGTLALAAPASADFTGLLVEDKTDAKAAAAGLFVCNVYAQFDNPDDQLHLVCAEDVPSLCPGGNLAASSAFYQHPMGGDTAPPQSAIDADPLARYDSFVTIGVKVDDGSDLTFLTPSSTAFDASSFSGSWFITPKDVHGVPVDGKVLIAQLTTTECPSTVTGTILIQWRPPGGSCGQAIAEFAHTCERGCPWDCQAVPDGNVGINDFLDLLGQWNQIGTPCDFGDGPPGVGVEDFLSLLAHWGLCP